MAGQKLQKMIKFEITFLDGSIKYTQAADTKSAINNLKHFGKIKLVRSLLEIQDAVEWVEVYTRKYLDLIAYVNAFIDNIPVASVPITLELEEYESLKENPLIVEETIRLLSIFPMAEIKVQKKFANGNKINNQNI